MALSYELLSEFAKITNDRNKDKENTVAYGEVIKVGSENFLRIDGSEILTPFEKTVTVKVGDRVRMNVENHTVTVTGNISDPSYSSLAGESMNGKIEEFDIIISHKITTDEIDAIRGYFEELFAAVANIDELNAVYAHIEELWTTILNADHINANDITAVKAEIEKIKAEIIETDHLSADELQVVYGYFNNIEAYYGDFVYVSTEILEAMKAKIDQLDVDSLKAKYAEIDFANIAEAAINRLKVDLADIDFANITVAAINNLTAKMVEIDFATINEATIKSLEAKYANIDFANIGEAAIKKLFADSGIIKDIIVEDGHITGELVGVTIKGDLIEGGTIVADKLVIKGEDGLFYKLNLEGLGEDALEQIIQDDFGGDGTVFEDGLHGSTIIAHSITADKVNVSDLVAFNATIGGFDITDHSIHSHAKDSALSTVRGIYMNDDGEYAIGDQNHYMRYYHDEATDTYKLEILADDILFGTGQKNLTDTIEDMKKEIKDSKDAVDLAIKSIETHYAKSNDSTTAPTEGWSTTAPTWEQGKFIWAKTVVTFNNGTTNEDDPVCITGNTGPQGNQGQPGQNGTSIYTHIVYSENSDGTDFVSTPTNDTIYIGVYTGTSQTIPSDKTEYTWSKFKGEDGKQGEKGDPGDGINTITYYYATTSTQVAPNVSNITSLTIPTLSPTDKYLWQKEVIDFTDTSTPDKTVVSLIAVYGDTGSKGDQGDPGQNGTSITISSKSVTYCTSSSGTSIPSSGWQINIPTVNQGDYLWTKTVVEYSDGNSTTSYSVAHAGKDGDDGDDGLGVLNIWEEYYLSTSKTQRTGGYWRTTEPIWEKGKYVWIRFVTEWTYDGTTVEKTTYSDPYLAESLNNSFEEIDSINDKINKWIQSVTTYYATNDSAENITDPVWSTTKPIGTQSQCIWVKNLITYSDGTSSETIPYCVYAYSESGATPSVTMTEQSDTSYNFTKINEWYQNTNQQQSSTTCKSNFSIYNNTAGTKTIEIEFIQDCEISYDYLTINGSSQKGKASGSYRFTLNAYSTYDMVISYTKDGSVDNGTDTVKFKFKYGSDSLNSIENQYYLSTSMNGLEGGSWSNVFPLMNDKNLYLWKRERCTWSNNEVTYGNPYLLGPCYVNISYVLNEIERCLNSTFGSTANGWEMAFNVITNNMMSLNRYIRFENGNIVLGEEGSPVTLKLENDIIAFYQFGRRVAYLSNGELKVTQATIETSLNLGNFEFVPGKNGNLTFRKKG